ncbi:MAG TPA: PQQ-binding-like beta-propeller repeat protein, partial [Gemmataceae bacterium]
MFSAPLALAAALALPAADPARPSDWPQWRGPGRDAVCTETGLLDSWPAGGPPLAWVSSGLGRGYSTPSVAAGRVFGMSYQGNNEVVWCVRADNGRKLWTTAVAAKQSNEGPNSTPTIDGGRVYALGVSGDLVCLDGNTGKLVWKRSLPRDLGGKMMSGWGYSESVLVDGDKLICTPGGDKAALAALDKKTGEPIWRSEIPGAGGAGYASVVASQVGDTKVYVTWLGSGLVGVRASDGKFLWRYTRARNGTANIPTPIVKGEYVFCSTAYGAGSALLKQVPARDNGVEVKEVYFLNANSLQNHHGGMVLVGDHVYLGHGHNAGQPRCIELMTGKHAWPQERGPRGTDGSAAVLYADGKLYFRYQNGVMALIEAA